MTITRNAALDGTSELRDEHIALVGTHHQHTSERIRFQQPSEGVTVLPVRIEPLELVSYEVESFVELKREVLSPGPVNLDRHVSSYSRATIAVQHSYLPVFWNSA